MIRYTTAVNFLALGALAEDLYTHARYHMNEGMRWPVGSPEREACMHLAIYYQEAARRVSNRVVFRRLDLVTAHSLRMWVARQKSTCEN